MANTLNLGTDGNWGVKKDSLLGYNSENGNFKPLAFNFTRASSATVVNKAGLIETVGTGEPRIDFSNDAKGALLLEPTRLNSLLQSNQFDTTWAKASATIESGKSGIGGSANAWKLTTSNSFGYLVQTISVSGTKTFSIYAKSDTTDGIVLRLIGGSNPYVFWSLVDGSYLGSGGGADLIDKKSTSIGNGWFRLDMTTTVDCTSVRVYSGDSAGNFAAGSIYIQYAQLEQGSYATSYIPNFGNSAGATRSADDCNNGGNEQVINSTEGVLYAEISALADDSTNRQITLKGADASNRLVLKYDNQSNIIQSFNRVGGSESAFLSATVSDITNFNKVAIKYKLNNYALWINGVEVDTAVLGTTWAANTLTDLKFSDGGSDFYGKVKSVQVYTTALSDAELQALTTL